MILKYAAVQCWIMHAAPGGRVEITFRQPLPCSIILSAAAHSAIRNDGLDARGINLMKFDGGVASLRLRRLRRLRRRRSIYRINRMRRGSS